MVRKYQNSRSKVFPLNLISHLIIKFLAKDNKFISYNNLKNHSDQFTDLELVEDKEKGKTILFLLRVSSNLGTDPITSSTDPWVSTSKEPNPLRRQSQRPFNEYNGERWNQ